MKVCGLAWKFAFGTVLLAHATLCTQNPIPPRGVCVFDIDRTLTATQLGDCPGSIPQKGVIDWAYGGNTELREASFAKEAIRRCADLGMAISIATHATGCSNSRNFVIPSKFSWVDKMIMDITGKPVSSPPDGGVSENHATAPFQCGYLPKSLMIRAIQAFWKVPFSSIVFFDDQESNLFDVTRHPSLKGVVGQLASSDRHGESCDKVNTRCCGLSRSEFEAGINQITPYSGQPLSTNENPQPQPYLSPSAPNPTAAASTNASPQKLLSPCGTATSAIQDTITSSHAAHQNKAIKQTVDAPSYNQFSKPGGDKTDEKESSSDSDEEYIIHTPSSKQHEQSSLTSQLLKGTAEEPQSSATQIGGEKQVDSDSFKESSASAVANFTSRTLILLTAFVSLLLRELM